MSATVVNTLDALPAWARQLSEKYYSRTFSMFVLNGNVRDLVPWKTASASAGSAPEFVSLSRFLQQALFGHRDLVITYDRGGGLSFADSDMQADFRRALSGY